MTDQFNENHLLWWVLKAVNACRANGVRPDTLLSETLWKNLGAPEWVLPAMRAKYDGIDSPKTGYGAHDMSEHEAQITSEIAAAIKALNVALEKAYDAALDVKVDYFESQVIGRRVDCRLYYADISKKAFTQRV